MELQYLLEQLGRVYQHLCCVSSVNDGSVFRDAAGAFCLAGICVGIPGPEHTISCVCIKHAYIVQYAREMFGLASNDSKTKIYICWDEGHPKHVWILNQLILFVNASDLMSCFCLQTTTEWLQPLIEYVRIYAAITSFIRFSEFFFLPFFLFVLTQFLLNNKHIFVIFGNLLGFSALTHLIPARPQFIFLLLSSILIEYSTHTHTRHTNFPGHIPPCHAYDYLYYIFILWLGELRQYFGCVHYNISNIDVNNNGYGEWR